MYKKISAIIISLILFSQNLLLAMERQEINHKEEKQPISLEEYIIKSGDILNISVWKHPDLEQSVKVGDNGYISFPLIGNIQAQGLTVSQLKDNISSLLGKDYIVDPLVTITAEKQNFYIYGEVKTPGSYVLEGKMTLLKAITLAGGLTDFASYSIHIKRKEKGKEKIIKTNIKSILSDAGKDILLFSDDVVIIPRRLF